MLCCIKVVRRVSHTRESRKRGDTSHIPYRARRGRLWNQNDGVDELHRHCALAYRRRTRTRPLSAFTTYMSLGTMRDDEALKILAAWRCPTDYPYAFVGDDHASDHESSQFANGCLSMNACHFAGRYGRVDILNWLKDKGAIDGMINQNIVGHMSPTPLMKALLCFTSRRKWLRG